MSSFPHHFLPSNPLISDFSFDSICGKEKRDFSFQIDGAGFGVVPFWLSMPSFPAHWSENVVYSISTIWNLRKCPSGLLTFGQYLMGT